MTTFVYKAKNRTTQTVSGQINAQNQEEAVDLITQLGLLPVSVVEQSVIENKALLSKPRKVRNRELYTFTKQLANLVRSGTSLLRSLEILTEQTQSIYLKSVIRSIAQGVKNGKAFSACLSDFPYIFSSLYVTMVNAGEEAGNIHDMLYSLATYLKKQEEIITKVRSALAYPLLMMAVGMGTVYFILTFVLPKMSGLFTNLGNTLPLPTVILLSLSTLLSKYTLWILLAVAGITFALYNFFRSYQGRYILSQMVLKFPLFGELILKSELARFCSTVELLLKSGVPILRSLQIAIPILGNDLLKEKFLKCKNDLTAGGSLGKSLKDTAGIPLMVGHLITVGEESGNLPDVLGEIAETYEQETGEQIKIMTTLLEPVMILLIGSIIGFIVFSILLPIFQIDVLAK